MTRVRQSTAARLRGAEIPEVFALATVASASRETYNRDSNVRDLRRLSDKAERVIAILAALERNMP